MWKGTYDYGHIGNCSGCDRREANDLRNGFFPCACSVAVLVARSRACKHVAEELGQGNEHMTRLLNKERAQDGP